MGDFEFLKNSIRALLLSLGKCKFIKQSSLKINFVRKFQF